MSILKSIIQQVLAFDLSAKDIKLKVMNLFSVSERDASLILIHAKNERNRPAVLAAKKRIAFIPHCVRSPRRLTAGNCRATFDADGYHCKRCDSICQVELLTDKLKIPLYVVPGSTMLFRIILRERPDAVIGFGCIREVEDGIKACEKMGIPVLGVPLMNEGCFKTLLNFDEARDILTEIGDWKDDSRK